MESEGRRALRAIATVFVVAGILVAVTAYLQSQEANPSERRSTLACDHYENVAADAAAGILTTAEIRTKVGQVYDSALSGTKVKVRARDLLAAITQGNEDIEEPLMALTEACADLR